MSGESAGRIHALGNEPTDTGMADQGTLEIVLEQ
jgi:hypothetical protein